MQCAAKKIAPCWRRVLFEILRGFLDEATADDVDDLTDDGEVYLVWNGLNQITGLVFWVVWLHQDAAIGLFENAFDVQLVVVNHGENAFVFQNGAAWIHHYFVTVV